MKFTTFEKEEIIHSIWVRRDTIKEDATSADTFETEESLDALEGKLLTNVGQLTDAEVKWMIEEVQNHLERAQANADNGDEGEKRNTVKYQTLISKLNSL